MNPIYLMGYPYNMGYQQPMRYQTPQQRLAEMEQQYPQFASNNQGQNFTKSIARKQRNLILRNRIQAEKPVFLWINCRVEKILKNF